MAAGVSWLIGVRAHGYGEAEGQEQQAPSGQANTKTRGHLGQRIVSVLTIQERLPRDQSLESRFP